MKRRILNVTYSLLLMMVMVPSFILSQVAEKEIVTPISEVTIHLKGAEIIREEVVSLSKGRNQIVFSELSPKINPKSIQVTATEGAQILSVTSKINFLKQGKKSPQIEIIQDSLKVLQHTSEDINNEKNAYERERDLLLKNQELKGINNGLTVEELQKAADFFRARFLEINKALAQFDRKRNKINEEINRFQRQLRELNGTKKTTSEVYIAMNMPAMASSTIRLRYVVDDAGWSPIYDLTATGLDEAIRLKYRALAFNNTGNDWEEVKITLSTADPYEGAGQPILTPWVLSTASQAISLIPKDKRAIERNQLNAYQYSQNFNLDNTIGNVEGQNIYFETIEISELNTDFEIETPYSIPSDFKPYSIDISEHLLPADFKHFVVPKLDKDAFLLAQITGWEELDLISGPMNVYQGEKYVGLANLDTRTLSDTLELSLGRDQKVAVKRTKKKEFSKKRFLGDKKISSFAFNIAVKNNHKTPINLEIQDQIPVSKNKEISVEVQETDGAQRFPISGKLVWELSLNPDERKEVDFSFAVKHPKNMEVKLKKGRQIIAPRYF